MRKSKQNVRKRENMGRNRVKRLPHVLGALQAFQVNARGLKTEEEKGCLTRRPFDAIRDKRGAKSKEREKEHHKATERKET
jgi:hypothetical protein